MRRNKIGIIVLGIILSSLTLVSISAQDVSADGCVFVDFGEHVYLPSQKAVILWNGTTETMIISTKINSSNLSNMAWVTPVPSSIAPQVSEGNIEVFSEIAESFAEYYGGGYYNEFCFLAIIVLIVGIAIFIIAFLKRKTKLSPLLIVLSLILIVLASFFVVVYMFGGGMTGTLSSEDYSDVELVEMKTVDFYDVAVLKATNATQLVGWLGENGFIVPDSAANVLQGYCDQDNFYFIVNKINLTNSEELAVSLQQNIENELNEMSLLNDGLKSYGIFYFEDTDLYLYGGSIYKHFIKYFTYSHTNWELADMAVDMILYETPYEYLDAEIQARFKLMNISSQLYSSLVEAYSISEDAREVAIYYKSFLDDAIDRTVRMTLIENGNRKDFFIPHPNSTAETQLSSSKKHPTDTELNLLIGVADTLRNLYHELQNIADNSESFQLCLQMYNTEKNITEEISSFSMDHVDFDITENDLTDYSNLYAAINSSIDTRTWQITYDLAQGLATPLEIVFQPEIPFYPLKMSSINEGSTKINVYFISDYHIKDNSSYLSTEGKSSLSWAPSLSEYNVGDHVTWMTYEGNTKDLTGDSYFVKID